MKKLLKNLNPSLTASEAFYLLVAFLIAAGVVRGIIWLIAVSPWGASLVLGAMVLFVVIGIFET